MSCSCVMRKVYSTVKPCDPTWRGVMALSELDQIGTLTHVPSIYLYRRPSSSNNNYAHTLKQSLSRALVPFYPLAGRLRWIDDNNNKGRLELDCNAMGVQFIEAHCELRLDDIVGDLFSCPQYTQLFPMIDYTLPIHHLPLLLVQLTTFKCGGLTIAISISHALLDGPAAHHFILEWAKLARGEPLQKMPFLNRKVLRAGEPPAGPPSFDHPEYTSSPPLLIGHSNTKEERNKKTTTAMLKLSKAQVESLRKMANESWAWTKPTGRKGYTRYETITGHIWRSTCKAREHKKEQATTLGVCVDARSRMKPELPKEYFGNATFDVVATSVAGELVSKPLGYAASKVREVIEKVTDEYIRSLIETLKKEEDLNKLQDIHALKELRNSEEEKGAFYGNPNIGVVSWLTLPLYGLDFGWGEEFLMGPGPDASDGCSLIFHNRHEDGSLIVAICLQLAHMDAFRSHFYQDIIM